MDTTTTCSVPLTADRLRGAPSDHLGTGELGEELAAVHLERTHGLTIIARNWRFSAGELRGELDVLAHDQAGGLLVVCEVKARRDAQRFGGALSAISPRKRAQVRRLAAAYLRETTVTARQVRLDVIAIDLGQDPTLTHLPAAL